MTGTTHNSWPAEVHTIERHEGLARTAAERLARAGYENVTVHTGDGTRGWPDAAPYDAIIVSAGAPRVPPSLREQLAIGGRLVIPVGEGRVIASTTEEIDLYELDL